MKKTLIFILTLFCCGVSAQGQRQEYPFELSSRYDDQRNAIIEVVRHDGGAYSVVLELSDLSNFTTQKFHRRRVVSVGNLLTLKPEEADKESLFGYKYSYIPGSVNPRKVDDRFIYRLPFSVEANREARELYDAYARHFGKNDKSVNFKAFQFIADRTDTVYAVRKGVVIRVVDRYDPITDMGEVSMNTDNNQVFVEHADGTIARYGVLEKGSITVEPTDTVYPGTPIALAGTLDGEIYQMQFFIYYQTDNLNDIRSLSDYSVTVHGINPLFSTSEGVTTLKPGASYTPAVSHELVTAEMTKKEVKELGR